MKKFLVSPRALYLLLLTLTVLALAGCATATDSENAAQRPWNSHQSWENGLPSSMMEGR